MMRIALATLTLGALACAGSGQPARTAGDPTAALPATAAPATPPPPPPPAHDYPASPRGDVVDQIHGVAVRDPYRWLEDPTRPEVADWIKAQDGYTRARLARLPHRDDLARQLAEVFYFDATGAPQHRKTARGQDRYFYSRKLKDREKELVYWRQGAGPERVLLDPNAWSADGSAGLRGWWPSDDGRYVAYHKTEHNADETTTYVLDLETGKDLADVVPGTKYAGASWAHDNRGFYYTWVPPVGGEVTVAARPGLAELRYHKLGDAAAKDAVLREATHNPQTFVSAAPSDDGHWLFAQVQHGWNSTDLYYRDLRKPRAGWTTLIEGAHANYQADEYRDRFYVRTNDGAPRNRIMAVDPAHPARDQWKQLVAEADATLDGFQVIGGRLVLTYARRAASEVELHDLTGALVKKLALPPLGNVTYIHGRSTEDDGYISYTSFTTPETIYKLSAQRGEVSEWSRIQLPIDMAPYTTEQVTYPSKDGTPITMFLIHRKDAVKDGKTPVYMTGYGGFNLAVMPGFVSSRSSWGAHAVWLAHGGMIAIPNLRGGGEYGEDWHKAGMLLEKQHVFDDFLAGARWLATSGWTSPAHLAIAGGSNGGLLVGAAVTQGPALFKAVVCEVPLLDMVRYHRFGSGATWVPEYGSADDAAQFQALYAYSPYHHVVPGTAYPAVLMSSADHDDRVDPLHARKFTAALQAATSSDAPIWLRIQANAGHAGVDQVKQRIEQNADTYAFLMWQLGME